MSIIGKAAVLRAMAENAADPSLRAAALEASKRAQLTGDELLQARNDTNAVLTFLLSLPPDKKAPTAASIGEVLDLDRKRVQSSLDALHRDGRLLSDDTLDPRVRANQKPGAGNSLARQSAQDAANARAAEQGTAAAHAAMAQRSAHKLVDPRGLRGPALTRAIGDVQAGRAQMVTKSENEQLASLRQQVSQLRATVQQLQHKG